MNEKEIVKSSKKRSYEPKNERRYETDKKRRKRKIENFEISIFYYR